MVDVRSYRQNLHNAVRCAIGFVYWDRLARVAVPVVVLFALWFSVVPNVIGPFPNKTQDTKQAIAQIQTALEFYKLDVGSFPSAATGLQVLVTRPTDTPNWSGPYLKIKKKSTLEDAWGHPYVYRIPSTRPDLDYDLCSNGGPRLHGSDVVVPICN
jgi:general secretion pathway protein G